MRWLLDWIRKLMKHALRGSKQIGPQLPIWPVTYPYPQRLRDFFYGIADSGTDPMTLASAMHDFPAAKVAKWAAITPKPVIQLKWEFVHLWPTEGSTVMSEDEYAAIKYIVQAYLVAGMNVHLGPQDTATGAVVSLGMHTNTAGTHYNWDWLVAAWAGLIRRLEQDLGSYGFGPDRVWLEVVNEMGFGVSSGLWSMPNYNAMWAQVIPGLRSAIRGSYTFLIDLYPYATPNQYDDSSYGGTGVQLTLPSDPNLVIATHAYQPGNFTQQGIGGTDPTDRLYIAGIPWGYTKAQILTYLSTYTPTGYHTGNAALDAQVDYWRTINPVEIETLGFTSAEIESALSGLIAYCRTNKRALCVPQWGALGYSSSTFQMSLANANAYEAAMTAIFQKYGLPHSYWIEQTLSDDPLRPDPANIGSESFVASRVAANVARTPPM